MRRRRSVALQEEVCDCIDDIALLIVRELRKYRQRERLASGSFGLRQSAFAVTQVRETFLLMQSERVVDRGADLATRKMVAQIIAARSSDYELVVDMMIRQAAVAIWLDGQSDVTR
jgi:hypothetical protein